MSFTDQKRRVATEKDIAARWGGGNPGERFRCYLCGHKFAVGDGWRWVFSQGCGYFNFIVCDKCDGPDVLERWTEANKEAERRFWWMR